MTVVPFSRRPLRTPQPPDQQTVRRICGMNARAEARVAWRWVRSRAKLGALVRVDLDSGWVTIEGFSTAQVNGRSRKAVAWAINRKGILRGLPPGYAQDLAKQDVVLMLILARDVRPAFTLLP